MSRQARQTVREHVSTGNSDRGRAISRGDLPFATASLAAGAALLYLGRSTTFWYDEWRSIAFDGTALDYLRPVNEHWLTIPLLLYRATFEMVELRSYLPYLAQVIVLHLLAVAAAYVLMRARVGRLSATLLALPLLMLGAGAENLFWAFQTSFVGSVAFGLWALVLLELASRRALVGSAALLLASLMSSGIGICFLVAAAVRALVDRELRARAVVVVVPAIVYVVWLVALGRSAIGGAGDLGTPVAVVRFGFQGIGHSVEAVLGLERLHVPFGLVIFGALCAVAGRGVLRGQIDGLAVGSLAGIASMYCVIGVGRASLEHDYAVASRYVYVAAFFLILVIADLARRLPSAQRWGSKARLTLTASLGVVLSWMLVANALALDNARRQAQFQADLTRAIFELAIQERGAAWMDPGAPLDLMPAASEMPALAARHGSPLEDAYFPSVVNMPSPFAYERAREYLSR